MKSNLLYRAALSIFLTVGYQFSFANFAVAQTRCEMRRISETSGSQRIDVQVGERTISILGWRHLSAERAEEGRIAGYLNSAATAALNGNCANAASNLTSLWSFQSPHVGPSLNLLNELNKINSERQIDVLAVEYSPQIWGSRLQAVESQANALDFIVEKCPSETSAVARNVAILFPGPEYIFMKRNEQYMAVEPVEDERVRGQVLPLVQQIDRSSSFISNLKPGAQVEFSSFMRKFALGNTITDADIEQVLSEEGQTEFTAHLAEQLRLFQRIISINPLRNERMADRILAGRGNYVFPIGDSHVRDLAQQLHSRCLNGEGLENNRDSSFAPTQYSNVPTGTAR